MGFSSTTAYNDLLKELAYSTREEFEKVCFDILQDIFPNIRQSKRLGTFDNSGFDLFSFTTIDGNLNVLFQCKGFQEEFGGSQLKQCLGSIDSFAKSSRTANAYYFVINKKIKDRKYFAEINDKLELLKQVGKIEKYEVFDIYRFLNFLLEKYTEIIFLGIKTSSTYFHEQFIISLGSTFYVEQVPFIQDNKVFHNPLNYINNRGKIKTEIGRKEKGKYFFIISEFGFGKTTLLFKIYDTFLIQQGRIPIYIPLGALAPDALANEGDFVKSVLNLLTDSRHNNPLVNKFKRGVFQNILKNNTNIILLLDGLDEHRALKNIKGLKNFFNSLTWLKPLMIFTMRKEFWDERQEDIRLAVGTNRSIQDKMILTDWETPQILEFVNEFQKMVPKSKTVSNFREIVEKDKYSENYGDIPKRPLFLQMILSDLLSDTHSETKISIGALYRKYISQKIRRDRTGSSDGFDIDRSPNKEEGILDFELRVFLSLEKIAEKMIFIENEHIFTKNIIESDSVNEIIIAHGFDSVSDLVLHSVLVPSEEKRDFIFNLKFAHFSFLEYFVARFILKDVRENLQWLDYHYDPSLLQFITSLLSEREYSRILAPLKLNNSIQKTNLGKILFAS